MMKFKNTVIKGLTSYLPEDRLSSEALELKLNPLYERLKLPQGRLELMTGIKERRLWDPGTRPSELSSKAANKLIEENNIDRKEIDLLIHGSVCRDFLEPSTASVVHSNLELSPHCQIFDLSNACLGVLSSINVAANMIESGAIKNALIVSGENGGPLVQQTIQFLNSNTELNRKDIKKYIANLTIGSAAFAILLSNKKEATKNGDHYPTLTMIESRTDSSANVLCQGDGDTTSLMMETDSEELMQAGVKLATETFHAFLENINWKREDIDWAIGHQVGSAHEALMKKTLEIEDIPTHTTYEYLGNTGSAACPVTLYDLTQQKEIKRGSKIALLGIGSGLHSQMIGVEW
jgi:3-oxoacyl-[acyl-carrier-protein] synthase III